MAMFKGFKPQGLQKIATRMGYAGRMENFDEYLKQNPDKEREMIVYRARAEEMAKGGYISMQKGGMSGGMTSAPNYQDFLKSDIYKQQVMGGGDNLFGVPAPAVIDPVIVGGKSYNFANPVIGGAYRNYMESIGAESFKRAEPVSDPRDANITEVTRGPSLGSTTPVRTNANQSVTQPLTDPRATMQQSYVPTLGESAGQVPAYGTTGDTKGIGDVTSTLAQTGAIPVGAVTQPQLTPVMQEQMIDPTTGQLTTTPVAPTYGADTAQAGAPTQVTSTQMQAAQATPAVQTAVQANQAAQADLSDPRAQVLAAQQTASSVSDLNAAQGTATLMDNPVQRQIQQGELIDGVANAEKASTYTEQVQAATATPSEKATVQGQLASLTADFDATNPPAWAAGALRGVQAVMQQRGLGASSMAGQAMIQAALESALPIAQADAQVTAQFEAQNLSNRQQRAMLAAQQRATFIGQEFDQAFQARVQNASRIGDIANMNFTAEQQVALENSRVANTMNLNNLGNRQAMVVAEASALANMDMSNLSNAQQAAVQNAQNFLQLDMANLSNEQQTALFNAQAINQSLLTDQAATNAARQFNATSQNQVDQFMATLANQVSQFNATQANAQNQFNAGELNTLSRFNAEVANQRDQFNATNQLAIAQNNAVWRREIATADTAAINRANELNAKAVLDVSNNQYDNLWQFYADTMEWAWRSAEGEQDRNTELAKANIDADSRAAVAAENAGATGASAIGNLVGTLGSAYIGSTAFTGFCWVAREVYGQYNPQWFMFRLWMKKKAPSWLYHLYGKYGESFALFISDKPLIKKGIKYFMNRVKL